MTLPTEMTVCAIARTGGPEVLLTERRPVPVPQPGEVLVAVTAAGVNRPDLMQRSGAYPPPKGASDLPGLEVAGTVAAVGAGVIRYSIGDAVCALTPGGGYAEYAVAPASSALPIPVGFSDVEAAALPETFFTVWANVFGLGRLEAGETLLVHGGTSGIGTVAIMLGTAFGARVIATAGSPEKCDACRHLGAVTAINYRDEDFVEAVLRATEGAGADVILDMVGGPYIERNYRAAAERGRIVQIAFQQGAKAEVDFTRLLTKRLVHTGSAMRPRTVAEKAAIAGDLEAAVWPLLAAGTVRPVIDRVFPFPDAAAAHRYLEAGSHVGKVMLALRC